MTAEIIILPPVYLIAYSSEGGMSDLVADFETRKRWEAEIALFQLTEKHPEYQFWITQRDLL